MTESPEWANEEPIHLSWIWKRIHKEALFFYAKEFMILGVLVVKADMKRELKY